MTHPYDDLQINNKGLGPWAWDDWNVSKGKKEAENKTGSQWLKRAGEQGRCGWWKFVQTSVPLS
jgi:hypothetical protein